MKTELYNKAREFLKKNYPQDWDEIPSEMHHRVGVDMAKFAEQIASQSQPKLMKEKIIEILCNHEYLVNLPFDYKKMIADEILSSLPLEQKDESIKIINSSLAGLRVLKRILKRLDLQEGERWLRSKMEKK